MRTGEALENIVTSNSSFRRMRKAGTIYIDKTKYLYKMLTTDDMYLLSRPR
jgi:hypothetical protein